MGELNNLSIFGVIGRIMAPKDAYALIPGTHEYITLHSNSNFADVIKSTNLEMGRLSFIIQVDPI